MSKQVDQFCKRRLQGLTFQKDFKLYISVISYQYKLYNYSLLKPTNAPGTEKIAKISSYLPPLSSMFSLPTLKSSCNAQQLDDGLHNRFIRFTIEIIVNT